MSMTQYRTRWYGVICAMFLFGACVALRAQDAPTPRPSGGQTLLDMVKIQHGDIRSLPQFPRNGVWGLLVGRPEPGPENRGVQIDQQNQGLIYPTTEMVAMTAGTIELSVITTTPPTEGDGARTLLDTWYANGNARLMLTLQDTKLQLAVTNDDNQTVRGEGAVPWGANQSHKLTLLWEGETMSLLADNAPLVQLSGITKLSREPLGIILGNSRDFRAPAKLALYGVRFSTAREATATVIPQQDASVSDVELSIRMAQGYQRRLYPLLDRLKQQQLTEVTFAYAMAYADIGDYDKALDTITPIANDARHPLYAQALFLRADLLMAKHDYIGAYSQLEVLTGTADVNLSVSARVKQATVLYEQGNQQDALRLMGEIIAQYADHPAVNNVYLLIGLDKFKQGNFKDAFTAFSSIGTIGAPPRESVAIGVPLEIKVADADLNVFINDKGLPVTVTSSSGDKETLVLKPAFSRGVYINTIMTMLGKIIPGDGVLQVQGKDKVFVTYLDRLSATGVADQLRTFAVDLRTDANVTMIAQSALVVFQEVQELRKKQILDDRLVLISDLPSTVSAFFRDPLYGEPRKKGWSFAKEFQNYVSTIKPGQKLYLELDDPDEDTTQNPDTLTVEVVTNSGKKAQVLLKETGAHTGIFTGILPTTPEGTPVEGALDVAAADAIFFRYVDPLPAAGTATALHEARVDIRATGGMVQCVTEFTVTDPHEGTRPVFVQIYRVSNGTPAILRVDDRDLDTTDAADTTTVTLHPEHGTPMPVTLTETGTHTGVFQGSVKVTTAVEPGALQAQSGDRIQVIYIDQESPKGMNVEESTTFRLNIAEDAQFTFQRQVILPTGTLVDNSDGKQSELRQPLATWVDTTVLHPGALHRVIMVDGDRLPTSPGELYATVQIKSSDGAMINVGMRGWIDQKAMATVYQGEFYVRPGDAGDPNVAFLSQTGQLIELENDQQHGYGEWTLPALNVQGKDTVQVLYTEVITADGKKNVIRTVPLQIADDAVVLALDQQGNPLAPLKPGVPFILQVTDANGDMTPKRDVVHVSLQSSCGDTLALDLMETDNHSGVFSAVVPTAYSTTAVVNGLLEVPFAGTITCTYRDEVTLAGNAAVRTAQVATRPLVDATGVLMTKIFDDPQFEAETLVRLGESLYAVGAAELDNGALPPGAPRTNQKLQEAKQLLQRVIDRFPTSDYVVESLYLTGKILREEQQFDEATKLFTRVIEEYPDSDFVPKALYEMVLLHYGRGEIDDTTEYAMQLVYQFPKNSLVAEAVLRIGEYYYNAKQYLVAAHIYQRLIDRFPDNPRVDLIYFRMATAYYRAGTAGDDTALASAIKEYLLFADSYSDNELADDALYWAARCYLIQKNPRKAFALATKILISYPDSDIKTNVQSLRAKILEDNPGIQAD